MVMVQLNLLPEKVRAAEALRKIILVGVAVYGVLALGLAWRFVAARSELALVQTGIDALRAELESDALKRTVAEVQRFTTEQADLKTKKSQVDVLRNRQVNLVRMFDTLPDLLPPTVHLTSLFVREEKGEMRFVVEGLAGTPEAVADFYVQLESHGLVLKPSLDDAPKYVDNVAGLGRDAYKFTMSFLFEEYK